MKWNMVSQKRDTELDVVPLVSVAFLLLVFFMLAGHLARPVSSPIVPPRSASVLHPNPAALQVTLMADGTMLLRGARTDPAELARHVRELLARTPDLTVALDADARVPMGQVTSVVQALRAAGAKQIQLATVLSRP